MVCPEHRWADLERVASLKHQDIMRRAGLAPFDEEPANAILPCWCGKSAAPTDEVRECAGCKKPARFPFQLYQRPWRAPFRRDAVRRTHYEAGRAPVAVSTTIRDLEPCTGLVFGYCRSGAQIPAVEGNGEASTDEASWFVGNAQVPTAEANGEASTDGSSWFVGDAQFEQAENSLAMAGPATSMEGDLGQFSSWAAEGRPLFATGSPEFRAQAESDGIAAGILQENYQHPSHWLPGPRVSEHTRAQQQGTVPSLPSPATRRVTRPKRRREVEIQDENGEVDLSISQRQRKRPKDSPATRISTKQANSDSTAHGRDGARHSSPQAKKIARGKEGSSYVVEEILDSRQNGSRKYEFFIKWLGEPADPDDTQNWLPWERIRQAEDFLADFQHANPDKGMPSAFRQPEGWSPLPAGQPRAWLDHGKPQYFEHDEVQSDEGRFLGSHS
ncbi:MAG: hypothetical protein Q9165_007329 [Trypethelium subeluteriae]